MIMEANVIHQTPKNQRVGTVDGVLTGFYREIDGKVKGCDGTARKLRGCDFRKSDQLPVNVALPPAGMRELSVVYPCAIRANPA
ncbi:hypothetical protein SAMN05444682_114149 [Parapedobacter indicus]|uniref:Uncharacterized protein n=2 Tax=Parapedobacter indicus TaxID=1477437 RepID=A0A1I3UHE8_9SPHI|nr:hypothetical protein CLV26_114149 [Parapedobacter indicus]SFJ82123.1 hypothetical protein SAMN05444682_114149 [Parapedobacter indicus]